MNVTLIDSPFANLESIARGLRAVGAEVRVTKCRDEVARAGKLILPGVGSFPPAMKWLRETAVADGLLEAVDRGAHVLGICLGHQLLFEASDEMGETTGLGLIGGRVSRFPKGVRVPKIGWNRVDAVSDSLFAGVGQGSSFYFVHSYRVVGVEPGLEIATAEYGGRYNAAVRRGRICGVQFHPEKSSRAGLRLLANFVYGSDA